MTRRIPLTALFVASGFRFLPTEGVNLGDVAQFAHGIELLRAECPDRAITAIAHSLNDESVFPDIGFSNLVARYLLGTTGSKAARSVFLVVRSIGLITAATLVRLGVPARWFGARVSDIIEEFEGASVVFFSGAGAFNSRYLKGPVGIWVLIVHIASRLGVPVVMVGQQIGPLDSWWSRRTIGSALRRTQFVGVRDHASEQLALELGVPRERVVFTGDEGLYLDPASKAVSDAYLRTRGISPGFVAVHFRVDRNCPFEEDIEHLRFMLQGIHALTGKLLLFVPMSYASGGDDRESHRRLAAGMTAPMHLVEDAEDARLTKAILGEASLAIGVANHFCIFAASGGVPTVGVYKTPYMRQKLEGIARECEHVVAMSADTLADPVEVARAVVAHGGATDRARFVRATPPPGYLDWRALLRTER